ncbi:unnamed protein product [Rhodiola kirilowii]
MPKKTPRRKKPIQISDEDTPDRRRNNRQAQNEARQLRALNRNFAAIEMNQNLLNGRVEDGQPPRVQQPVRRTLGDYTTPRVTGFQSAIAPPGIEANTWELKTGLIQMVQNSQFSGRVNEDPHHHLKRFVQMCNTVKTNGVSSESYYLRLFPFSLSDKASRWLDSHAEGTFTTWNRLAEAFLQQYFPPSKTAHFRNKIISFRSIDGETLYDAWERYKELTRMCPHHNLEEWQIIDTFYQGIDQGMRTLINQAAGGGLNGVPLEDAYGIIERAALDYHLWTSDRGNPRDRKGVQDLCQVESTNDIARLADSMKILATEIQNMKLANSMKSSDVAHIGVYCQICGSPSHYADSCPVIGSDNNSGNQEDANYVGQNNQGTGFGYGSATNRWDNQNRNSPNLSYKPQNQVPSGFPYRQQQDNAPYQPRNQYNNQAQGQQNQNSGGYSYQPQQPKQQETSESSGLEGMMAKFMADQERRAQEADRRAQEAERRAQEQEQRVKELEQTIRMIGNQVAQQADSAHREPGKLPSKPEHHHRESVNAITLGGGEHIEMVPAQATRTLAAKSALNSTPAEGETSKEAENRAKNSAPYVEPAPYMPPIPFPQRLKGARRDKEFMQFVDKVRTLYITMPFTDAITKIPTYAQFMKEIMSGKRKIDGTENVALSEECSAATHQPVTETIAVTEDCSAALHQPMPPKLQDSGSFSIPCDIGGFPVRRALCDLGASVSIMPYSLYAKLNLGDLCPTNITIRLADRSCRLPRGILKDVPVKVKNLHFPADFIVLDISEDVDIPIILGRPFLYTAKAVIDMDRCSLTLRVGSDRIVFNLPDMSKSPSLFADCDILDSAAAHDPISLTSIEPCRVLQGSPIQMNVCAVSTEGVAGAGQTIGSGKGPCEGELKPLLDPGDVFKERTTKWHYKRMVRRNFRRGKRILLYKSRLKLFPGKLCTKWSGPYTVERVHLDDHQYGTKGGKSVVDGEHLKHGHILKHREPPDDIGDCF